MAEATVEAVALRVHLCQHIIDFLPEIRHLLLLLIKLIFSCLFVLHHLVQLIFLLFSQRSIWRLTVKKVQVDPILLLRQGQWFLVRLISSALWRIEATFWRDLKWSSLSAESVAWLLMGFYVDLSCSFCVTHSFFLLDVFRAIVQIWFFQVWIDALSFLSTFDVLLVCSVSNVEG